MFKINALLIDYDNIFWIRDLLYFMSIVLFNSSNEIIIFIFELLKFL